MTIDSKLLHSPVSSHTLLQRRTIQIREYPSWKRRRVKINRSLQIQSQLGSSPWENLMQNVDFIAPALGLASGAALYLSRLNSSNSTRTRTRTPQVLDIGDWILFTSPTPFNRFVTLRCPSISFPGSELLEGVVERLVKEERHSVRVNSGRIQVTDSDDAVDDKLAYQRLCVSTDDGGVISLDWPANLELTEEHGLDTTVLIIPGTAEGSADTNIRSFVFECLSRGCFPVVMNPRGCAGSPLTTPRLFTAADSDDVYAAIQFINKSRPWTTLMAVGWGYGANMLTKYFAEVGEKTPVIAATCIDNPFDLEEATAFSLYNRSVHQKLTSGLQDILRNNKAIFQGRGKGFDVEKALSTTSLRDFDKEISMMSHGLDAIEEFYKKSSTQGLVGNVKIPLLFVQNDSGRVPQFSIPRTLIAENPFTSLLLCSRLNSYVTTDDRSTISWSQNLAIEWLAAVELGLLKGRHPLLEDVDVTINPSKGLALVESKTSEKSNKATKLLNLPHLDDSDVRLKAGDNSAMINSKLKGDSQINHEVEEKNVDLDDSSSTDVQTEEVDSERGNVLQTAEVVMNMLDVTMPDILTEEKKKKVLAAVGRGETLMGALQAAVPEEVRGTLTTAVSGILNNPGSNLKLERLLKIVPDATSGFKSKKLPEAERKSSGDDMTDSSKNIQAENSLQIPTNTSAKEADKLGESNEPATKSENKEQLPEKVDDANIEPNGTDNGVDKDESNKVATNSEKKEKISETHAVTEKADDVNIEKSETGDGGDKVQPETKAESASQINEEQHSPCPDEKKPSSVSDETPAAPSSAPETTMPETAGDENQISEAPNTSVPPVGVSNALDVFTGMDDSTQVAVNSVFNVLEDMINQLEVAKDENVEVKGEKKENDGKKGPSPQNHHQFTKNEDNVKIAESIEVKGNKKDNDDERGPSAPQNNHHVTKNEETIGKKDEQEEKLMQKVIVPEEKNISSNVGVQRLNGRHSSNSSKTLANLDRIPKSIAKNPYGDSLYKEYLRQYLVSKIQYTEPMDIDTTTALFLDYIHEEGQWKLLERTDSTRDALAAHEDEIIEPSYVIRDAEKQEGYLNGAEVDKSKEVALRVKSILLDSLKVEVCRRLSAEKMEEMETILDVDINQVADSVSVALANGEDFLKFLRGEDKVKSLNGERLIKVISSAVDETIYLRKVVPVGLIVGSSMASLKKMFNVSPVRDKRNSVEANKINDDQLPEEGEEGVQEVTEEDGAAEEVKTGSLNNNVMVGAVTAALGASTLLAQQGSFSQMSDAIGDATMSFETTENNLETGNSDEETNQKSDNNVVASFAEKAMSVAGPVVPTKEDGGIDQERLVAMLAEWGQKGGMMRLVGKLALLWGGLRGATSLTNKLISFLHIAERNLLQRILAFVVLALILWSPVVVPLLPTLVQGWTTNTSSNFAEFACVVGLYVSVIILIALWGKRIRNYENALVQYGLDFTSTVKIKNFGKGLIVGVVLTMLTQSVNVFLGCVCLTFPSTPNSSLCAMEILSMSGKMLMLLAKGFFTASCVALVEELFFRSWLPDEIAADLGYQRGIIISGLAFSLFQRSVWAAPGLWLLSLGLAGARERNQGSLSLPIGIRSGMIASAFTLKTGGLFSYQPNLPIWVTGSNPFEPFSGIVGMSFALLFALLLYPRGRAQGLLQTPKEAQKPS